MTRKSIPTQVETDVIKRARRRCAICYGLKWDTQVKRGQIAHIDQDNTNVKYENLVFLCLEHHDEYDSSSHQSKGITPNELKFYREELDSFLENEKNLAWPDYPQTEPRLNSQTRQSLPIDVYTHKIQVYRTVRDYLRNVIREANVTHEELRKFVQDTDEALFLFDSELADYLKVIYKKSVALLSVNRFLANPNLPVGDKRSRLAEEDAELLTWFTDQVEVARELFYNHISL